MSTDIDKSVLEAHTKKIVKVGSLVAYEAIQILKREGNPNPSYAEFLARVLFLERDKDQTQFSNQTQTQATDEPIKLYRDWYRFKSSHTYTELADVLNISYNTAIAYANLPIPPKHITVPPGFTPTYLPKRAYRVAAHKARNGSVFIRFTHGTKTENDGKSLNISPTTRFYSDMSEEAKTSPELVLLRSFELALAARLQAFGLHIAGTTPFPERQFVLDSLYQNDRGTSYGNPEANRVAAKIFPLYDSHGEKTYRCASHKEGDRPLSIIELRMKEFFLDDFEEIRARICLRHKDSPLTLFYCLGDIKTTQEASQILRDLAK